jgi:Tfp pilus assembly protein FimT
VLGLVAVLTAAAVPQALASLDHDRALVAARYLVSRMRLARMQAVSRSAAVALRVGENAPSTTLESFVDGNGDGVRSQQIAAGVDREVDASVPLEAMFPGVVIGMKADPDGRALGRVGVSTLLSFTPVGTSSSGSVYVTGRDGSRYAVRVLGATGRVRVQRFDEARAQWVQAY